MTEGIHIYDTAGGLGLDLRPGMYVRREAPTFMTRSAVCANTVRFSRSRYTGKERDAESGLDYFGARYYASSMGRWMSPDWSAKQEPVPYAKLGYPQSLNLYSYVLNNPLSGADADGHDGCGDGMDSNGFGGCAAFGNHPLDKNDAIVAGGVTALFLAPVALEAAAVGVRSSIGFISRTAMSAYLGISVLGTKAAQSLISSRDAVSSSINAIKDAAASGEISLPGGTANLLRSAGNAVSNNFTNSDINGALKQSATCIEAGGDHVQELQDVGTSLTNLSGRLSTALANPTLSDQTRSLYQNAVKAIQPTVDQINKLKK